MSDLETAFHKRWRGLVEPVEGLVVSVPVLVAAECMHKHGPDLQEKLRAECDSKHGPRIRSLESLFVNLLGFSEGALERDAAVLAALGAYLPEGSETVTPTLALKARGVRGGDAPYVMLVWDVPDVDLGRPDTREGKWAYPPKDKFDRLLRHARVPIGLLSNRRELRLFYAPHDESTGIITFRVGDMVETQGREILDAFVMLLSAHRFFAVAKDRQLPALLAESRLRQANVTTALASQVLEALAILLRGFEAASLRDGDTRLREAVEEARAYPALLTVLLRLVFLLYAEDLSLLPVGHAHYAEHLSILSLHARLQADAAAFPDTMPRRFGAWPRLLALFRAVYCGLRHGELSIPPRRGVLFDPAEYPFLEGWGPSGGAPTEESDRAAVRTPSVDDETVFQVLDRLIILDGERLSYRALDVEQIGSVYEALMGYAVEPTDGAASCLKPFGVWVSGAELLTVAPKDRARWLEGHAMCVKREVAKVTAALVAATTEADALDAIEPMRRARTDRSARSQLVLQPGPERRRTSSHYTPRSLSEPIVRRTLEPLVAAMGDAPSSARLLDLKVCDPAMGSGAFLVAACRFLAAELVAAWTREKATDDLEREHGKVLLYAKRLVAQRCLYGVDKNALAVNLAKLSLWLETLAKDEPFTFLDHALKHGDSLVGLSLDQIRAFHWAPADQIDLATREIDAALAEAVRARQEILDLAKGENAAHVYVREKERLLFDAEDALAKARLLGDLVVGAFFAHEKPKDREAERVRRLDRALAWLREGGAAPDDLVDMQRAARAIPTFHWMAEFPEVFYAERPDPLDPARGSRVAMMDAFVGNPPFMGGLGISSHLGNPFIAWSKDVLGSSNAKADLVALFFLRSSSLIGGHGTLGLIATNTVAQGDTREAGLARLLTRDFVIYEATRSLPWPGDAAVAVSVVHLAKGSPIARLDGAHLDGVPVAAIDSYLRPRRERPAPRSLQANDGLAFQGVIIQGAGFVVDADERARLIARHASNEERIRPYLGGEELNTHPDQAPDRFVIALSGLTLDEAAHWPDLLQIVRERVKPERDKLRDDQATARVAKAKWWRFWAERTDRFAALASLKRCLVASRVTKHLCFSVQPTDRIFSDATYVFAVDDDANFAVLQSRSHEAWARLLSSSLEDRLRYSASDCFETFPFPEPLPDSLAQAGAALYEARAAYMTRHQRGFTETYNRMKDVGDDDAEVRVLRALSEEMDRAVLAAYGWSDVEVPAFAAGEDDPVRGRFEDVVLDRLFALNAERAEMERVLGLGARAKGAAKAKKEAAGGAGAGKGAGGKGGGKRGKKGPDAGSGGTGQGGLPGVR